MRQFLLTSVFLVLHGIVGCSASEPDTQATGPRPAKLFEVQQKSVTERVHLPATVEASYTTAMTFQVSGQLKDLPVKEGDEVTSGQVLAQLGQRAFINAVNSAQAEFTRADNEYKRAKQLLKTNAISQSTVDARLAQRDAARAELDSAEKDLDDSVLKAPFSGVIAKIDVDAFETVGPQQPILILQSSTAVEALVQVPASIVIASQQVVPQEISLELDAAPGVLMPATLVEAAAVADPGTQTFAVRFQFEPPDEFLVLPGMTGTLRGLLPVNGRPEVSDLIIPISAVISQGDETFTWVVDTASMVVSRRPIEVDVGVGEMLRVTHGVSPGETVVSAGGHYLHDGATVRRYTP